MKKKYKYIIISVILAISIFLLLYFSLKKSTPPTPSLDYCCDSILKSCTPKKGSCVNSTPVKNCDGCTKPNIHCCNTVDGICTSNTSSCVNSTPVSSCNKSICKKNTPNDWNNEYVKIFKPGDDSNTQKNIDDIFKTQGGYTQNHGQFSNLSYALLFMPGTYNVSIPVGYYTHVAGLGNSPTEVIINQGPYVYNSSNNPDVGALNNFWRSCENMTIIPNNPILKDDQYSMIWAVSQAASLRSVHIEGNLNLFALTSVNGQVSAGYASGGFLANCKVSKNLKSQPVGGTIDMGSQQQFICRNSTFDSFPNALWNQVLVGCNVTDPIKTCCVNTKEGSIPSKSNTITVIEKTPSIKEKPYLISSDKSINIFIPSFNSSSSGISISTGDTITNKDYYIVKPGVTASDINTQLKNSKHIIFFPGIYTFSGTINLSGQLLFGLGFPRISSTGSNDIVNGYGSLCGIIFEAGKGKNNKNTLVNLNSNPSYLWDIYCRVGGGIVSKNNPFYSANTMLYIGGDNSIVDNTWCWVADHYSDGSYTFQNALCNTGIHVTGENVTFYGMFSEHNQIQNVLWKGENGSVFMYQSEFNYFFNPTTAKGKVSYDASSVISHNIHGAGAYSFFPCPINNKTYVDSGFKFPTNYKTNSSFKYENIFTIFLNGYGGITNVINSDGPTVEYNNCTKGNKGNNNINCPLPKGSTPPLQCPTQLSYICNKTDTECDCTCPSDCKSSGGTCTLDCKCMPADGCTVAQKNIACPSSSPPNCSQCGSQYKCITNGGCYPTKASAIDSCAKSSDVCQWW
jgi:hypothetical protein